MELQDKKFVCRDCGQEFTFSVQEQEDFKKRGMNPPTRCSECHEKRVGRRKFSRGGDCRTFTVPCSICGKDAELPFRPKADKPVYCTACYNEKNAKKPARRAFNLQTTEKAKPEVVVPAGGESFGGFELDSRLDRAVREAGYDLPTPVQSATIPLGLQGLDLIGTAQTGTGKTAAFVLPILQHLLTNRAPRPCTRAIILTPTRELAEQINDTFKQLGKHTRIRTATVYGGVGMIPQERALANGADVIVACPGRLLDHIERGNTRFANVDHLILDEADRMLDMGFLPPIRKIISHLPKERQTMLFSATFAPELMKLTVDALKEPQRVAVDLCAPPKTIAHALYPCPQHLKTALLLKLLDATETNSVLIFTKTKHRANRLAQQVERAGYSTAALHANKSQNQRQAALDDFRSGRCQIMVATDIAARGIDVDTISHVINFDIPDTADTYIHRIGRTGRAEREGDAMTLVTKQDAGIIWDIEKALGGPIERRRLDDFDYNTAEPAKTAEVRPQPRPRPASPKAAEVVAKLQASAPGYYTKIRKYRSK